MRFSILYIAITISFLLSCTKDKVPEVSIDCVPSTAPADYFPAFQETWWNYKNSDNETVNFAISDEYEICEGECRAVFLNLDRCVEGNSLLQMVYGGMNSQILAHSPLYSLVVDSVLICPISFATFQYQEFAQGPSGIPWRRITTTLDTSITLTNNQFYDDVIIVKEYNINDSLHNYFDYFSKNVGLIKRDSVSIIDSTQKVTILELEDYYIGQ